MNIDLYSVIGQLYVNNLALDTTNRKLNSELTRLNDLNTTKLAEEEKTPKGKKPKKGATNPAPLASNPNAPPHPGD